jgi:hypothetical protein
MTRTSQCLATSSAMVLFPLQGRPVSQITLISRRAPPRPTLVCKAFPTTISVGRHCLFIISFRLLQMRQPRTKVTYSAYPCLSESPSNKATVHLLLWASIPTFIFCSPFLHYRLSWTQDRQPPIRALGTSGSVVQAATLQDVHMHKGLAGCPDP